MSTDTQTDRRRLDWSNLKERFTKQIKNVFICISYPIQKMCLRINNDTEFFSRVNHLISRRYAASKIHTVDHRTVFEIGSCCYCILKNH